MKQTLFWVLLLAGFGLSRAAQAQYHHSSRHCCCCPRDTASTTERTNRTALLLAPTLALDAGGQARGGVYLEVGRALRPRLTVGGSFVFLAHRASPDNYGYEATAPAVGVYALAGSGRYQLLNARRWRVEALGSLGVGGVQLVDRDQQVPIRTKYGYDTRPATVAFRVHPLAELGVGTTYKLAREFWLTSRLSYSRLAWSSALGAPGEFSYWQVSVGAAVPWGYRPH